MISRKYHIVPKISYPYIGTILHVLRGYMRILVILIIILSALDAAATIVGIELNYISEANPVIAPLVITDPFMVCTFACLIAAALVLMIYRFRKKVRWLKYSLYLILTVKAAVVCLHAAIIVLAAGKGLF
jgi:hypothetical protein